MEKAPVFCAPCDHNVEQEGTAFKKPQHIIVQDGLTLVGRQGQGAQRAVQANLALLCGGERGKSHRRSLKRSDTPHEMIHGSGVKATCFVGENGVQGAMPSTPMMTLGSVDNAYDYT